MSLKPLNTLLTPLSWLYGAVVTLRNAAYDRNILSNSNSTLPVICVGNATAGGSGKSPFAEFLTEYLLKLEKKPAILSRGYGGNIRGPHLVKPNDSPGDVGDEPLMHAQAFENRASVVICRDRVLGAKFIAQENLGDIIILDDGFQHRRLNRDLNILLLDVSSKARLALWQNRELLPKGRLREPLSQAFRRADCVVFIERTADKSASSLPQDIIPEHIPCFHFTFSPKHFRDVFTDEHLALEALKGTSVLAITAIASPNSFFDMLTALEFPITQKQAFGDHHAFSESDWKSFCAGTTEPIITTIKDAVKLKRFVTQPKQLYALKLKGAFVEDSEKQDFFSLLEKKGT